MDIFNYLEKIATKVTDSLNDSLEEIKDTVNDLTKDTDIFSDNSKSENKTQNSTKPTSPKVNNKPQNTTSTTKSNIFSNLKETFNKSSNRLNTNRKNPIFYFPKLELIARKEKTDNIKANKLSIEDFQKKYSVPSLNSIIKSFSDEEKANMYYFIGNKYHLASIKSLKVTELLDIAINYLSKSLAIFPNNKEYALELFNICYESSLGKNMEKGIEAGELYIKLSDNIDKEKNFSKIYTYIGKYYYLEKREYNKALEYYQKALEYSENGSMWQREAYRYLGILNEHLGNYKIALEFAKKSFNPKLSLSFDAEWISDLEKKVANNVTKEEEDRRIFLSDMKYTFKNSVGIHPEEVLIDAYKRYKNAEEFGKQGKTAQAIEEYKAIKKLLPEQTKHINEIISMFLIGCENDEINEKYKEELFKNLQERLEICLKTNNTRDLCGVYNELGVAYSNVNNYDKAVENYKKGIECGGLTSTPAINLADCYKRMGLYDEAIALYNKIKKANPYYASQYNVDYNISHINDLKSGKIGKDQENNLDNEHCIRGNEAFEREDYKIAFREYNAASTINANNSDYMFRKLMVKEMYESQYSEESTICLESLGVSGKTDDFEYLPFFLTIYGDCVTYEAWGNWLEASIYYEIATYLLDMVPTEERFAAPYFKLGRLKEQDKKYKEALSLFNKAKAIDFSYRIAKDIKRVNSIIKESEAKINSQASKLISSMKISLDTGSYSKTIADGKEALNLIPNSVDVYYLICQAAEKEKDYYELKWAAKEGLRLSVSNYDKSEEYFDYFIFTLGKCCNYENKLDQAEYYFKGIVECDEYNEKEYTSAAESELYRIRSMKNK